MMCRDGKIKIIDFGIAKQMMDYHDEFKQGTQEGKFIGKVNYASPEQADGKHWMTNATSDIYSTGILLFELLTGRLPYTGSTYDIIKGHRERPIPICDSISPELQYVINKATAKQQADRYQSAAEFIVDLEKIEQGKPVLLSKTNWLWKVLAAMLLLVFLAGGTLIVLKNRDHKVEKARNLLAVGMYAESLDLLQCIHRVFATREVKRDIFLLEALVPAIHAYNRSDYVVADSLLKLAARYGSPDAYYYLGEMCYEGLGTPKDYKMGYEFTNSAYEKGSNLAAFRLGLVFDRGLGQEVDQIMALKYYERAGKVIDQGVDLKNPERLFIKGNMYMNGRGVPKSDERGREYYTEAAMLGYPQAQFELYRILFGIDSVKAMEWLKRSADQGYPKAEFELGLLAESNGLYKEALQWMQQASMKNYSPAYQRLGLYYSEANALYAERFGIQSNNATSHAYTEKALKYDFENFQAMHDLWVDYSRGIGVHVDEQKANHYFQMAKTKLNELPYVWIAGNRRYVDPLAQEVWEKLTRPKR